jgi:hypothetical protein
MRKLQVTTNCHKLLAPTFAASRDPLSAPLTLIQRLELWATAASHVSRAPLLLPVGWPLGLPWLLGVLTAAVRRVTA